MGSLLSLFRSKDAKKRLEEIQNEIESIEDFKDSASRHEKNFFFLLFTIFTLIGIGLAIGYYYFVFIVMPTNVTEKIIYFSPFIVILFVFFGIVRFCRFIYRYKADNKDDRLKTLKKQKKKILEKVKETENFKDAKEILEKYDPRALLDSVSFRTLNAFSTPLLNNSPQRLSQTAESQLRYRGMSTPMRPMPALMSSPSRGTYQPTTGYRPMMNTAPTPMRPQYSTPQLQALPLMPPPLRTVKPILPQKRSVMEKVVDYVVGDGPTNRYALICVHCYSHNGMALREEFEFIAFICCYCKRFNAARKMRPSAPRLQPTGQSNRPSLAPVVDEPESDTDSERGRLSAAEDSTRIQEILTNTESDTQNVVQSSHDLKDDDRTEDRQRNASEESVGQTSEADEENENAENTTESTGNTSEGPVTEDKSEHDVNDVKTEEKEIPFMDESGL